MDLDWLQKCYWFLIGYSLQPSFIKIRLDSLSNHDNLQTKTWQRKNVKGKLETKALNEFCLNMFQRFYVLIMSAMC